MERRPVGHGVFLSPLQPHVPEALHGLYLRAGKDMTHEDRHLGARLLADTYCDLLDACFVHLLAELGERRQSRALTEAAKDIAEVKGKVRYYVSWVAGLLSGERISAVVRHFHGVVRRLERPEGAVACLVIDISPSVAANARRIMKQMRSSDAGVDDVTLLITQLFEDVLGQVVIVPKYLLNLNFVISKTLDGVIALVRAIFRRSVKRLGPELTADVQPLVAAHLDRFLLV